MKNFLRKLHIGEGSGEGGSSPPPPQPSRKGDSGSCGVHHHPNHEPRQQQPPSAVWSWLDSVPTRSPPPIPVEAEGPTSATSVGEERSSRQPGAGERRRSQEEDWERRRSQEDEMERERRRSRAEEEVEEVEKRVIGESSEAEERKREREKEEDELEKFQLQLVLEMSVRDNPEVMEIEVAKQISLGFCPPQSSPAEVLAVRYWSFNALGYDDKISDGFYDLYFNGNGPALVTRPSLVELRAQPFSQKVNWEAVLVNRGEDHELMKLEQKALIMALELQSRTSEFVGNALVQRLANLVASHMGGLVFDPESMSVKYQSMISSLRTSIGSVVVPLGQLKIGFARHRALLFKVLADGLDVPCRLLKGRQYTGLDDGALNIVKFKDGREFIVDLMADPGTLIPSDGSVLSTEFGENSVSDSHYFNKDDTTDLMGSSLGGVSSSAHGSFEYELVDRRSTPSIAGPSDTDGATTSLSQEMEYRENMHEALERILINTSVEPVEMSFAFLQCITNEFSDSKVIGRGGFGVVYMGFLQGKKIAVKKLSQTRDFSDKQFQDELTCLRRVKHRNIVRFLGYCSNTQVLPIEHKGRVVMAEERRRFLCFEYVPNTLHDYIKVESDGQEKYDTHYKLLEGICYGLRYLHNEERIAHLDLKPENILVDVDKVPKITDFGLSRRFSGGHSKIITKNILGSQGYIAPEYWNKGEISYKADIFSLGIIIRKLFCGSIDSSDFENWYQSLHTVSPQVKRCFEISKLCVDEDPRKRPTIDSVIDMLSEETMIEEKVPEVHLE
ncbi:hypothetical protein ACP4OV_002362 [Aristida adscensionis]